MPIQKANFPNGNWGTHQPENDDFARVKAVRASQKKALNRQVAWFRYAEPGP